MSEENLYSISIEEARANYLSKYNINSNLLESTKYLLVTHNLPNLNFFAQGLTFPSVNGTEILQSTPLSDIYMAGDKILYDPLTISFLVDEDLRVWEECASWLIGYTFPQNYDQYKKQLRRGIYCDMSLLVLKNSYESNLTFRFYNAFPTSVGPFTLNSSDSADAVMTTDVTFRFDSFSIIRG
jgi:hypothetical protein